MGSLLHVGCGGEPIPDWAQGKYVEVRLDIDERHAPDIVASMTDMGDIGPFNAIYSSHSLEHLYPHDVDTALREFHRVLDDGGFVVILVPDLEDVRPTEDVILDAPCGPITGLDMIYGLRSALANQPHMAHRTGFTSATLRAALDRVGFQNVVVQRMNHYNLMAVASK